jgi:Ca2+-binding RTX toxin-like protein
MRRITLLLATTVGLVFMLAGVALAVTNIDCVDGSTCTGTSKADFIRGTQFPDSINALGANDVVQGNNGADLIQGGSGDDVLCGDCGALNLFPTPGDDDTLYGEGGDDELRGLWGHDLYVGGGGNDLINADYNFPVEVDRVDGGRGNDKIRAHDESLDHVTCGEGSKDIAQVDVSDDVDATCEFLQYSGFPPLFPDN